MGCAAGGRADEVRRGRGQPLVPVRFLELEECEMLSDTLCLRYSAGASWTANQLHDFECSSSEMRSAPCPLFFCAFGTSSAKTKKAGAKVIQYSLLGSFLVFTFCSWSQSTGQALTRPGWRDLESSVFTFCN